MLLSRFLRILFKEVLEAREHLLAGLLHHFDHPGRDVLGRDLEVPADVIRDQLADVFVAVLRVGEGQIVADAAGDEGALHARQFARLLHQLNQRRVIGAELLADGRIDARGAAADLVPLLVGADHVPHVGGGAADVRDHASPAGDIFQALDLAQHRGFAARDHVAPLVLGDAAEAAACRAAAHDGDGETDLFPGGDLARSVHRMRQPREGQLIFPIDERGIGRRRGRIDVDQVAPVLLNEDARVIGIVLEVVEPRELRVGLLVGGDLLVGRQPDLLPLARAREVAPALLGVVAEAHRGAADIGEAADVLAVRQAARDIQDRLLAHSIDEEIGGAIDEDGMADAIAPVIVMREPPQRRLDAADHHRHVGEELLQLARIDGGRVIGSLSGRRVRRIGVRRAPLLAGRVMVDHRIHVAARHAEEEPRAAAGEKVLEPAAFVPSRLGDDPHLVPPSGEQAADQRHAEGRVIDVRVAVDEHHVELRPASPSRLVERHRQISLGRRADRLLRLAARAEVDEAGHRRGL